VINNNLVQYNDGGGIWFVSSNVNINVTKNVVTNNNWGGIVFQVGSNVIPGILEKNTITYNEDGIRIDGAESPADYSWQYNNIHDNIGLNVENKEVSDWYMLNNWWGTTDTDKINQSIFDYYDDFNYGKIIYIPFLTGPYGEKSIKLKQGFNLISLPTIQPDESLEEVLSPILGKYSSVQWYEPTDPNNPWKHYSTSKPSSTSDLTTINHTMAFFIYQDSPGEIDFEINGDEPTENQIILLYPGWNLVGYPSLTNHNRTIGLNNLEFGTDVDCIQWFDAATCSWNFMEHDDSFSPTRGYWVHSKSEFAWEVPL
jgi:parallel beta-helix repeat protein